MPALRPRAEVPSSLQPRAFPGRAFRVDGLSPHSTAQWQQRRRRISPNDGGGAAPSAEPPASDFDADEEEETVDQRVAASRQQIKGLLRALAASRAGSHNPDALPKQSTPATRRSKLDLRMATAAHRKRTPEEE